MTGARRSPSFLTVRKVCRANIAVGLLAVNARLAVQDQMTTVGHFSEKKLSVTHLLMQVRGFMDGERRDVITKSSRCSKYKQLKLVLIFCGQQEGWQVLEFLIAPNSGHVTGCNALPNSNSMGPSGTTQNE